MNKSIRNLIPTLEKQIELLQEKLDKKNSEFNLFMETIGNAAVCRNENRLYDI